MQKQPIRKGSGLHLSLKRENVVEETIRYDAVRLYVIQGSRADNGTG